MAMTNRNIEETLRETEIPDKSRVELNVHSEEDAIGECEIFSVNSGLL